jgi:hypothetical protein
MTNLRLFLILAWISIPTVMYGGYSLLRLLNAGNQLTPFQVQHFRAGHAHAGVLLIMSLAYYFFLDQTGLPIWLKVVASIAMTAGILAQSGGFFLTMVRGEPASGDRPARYPGVGLTTAGALLMVGAIIVLVYGLISL